MNQSKITLFNGDCLDILPQLPDHSIDMILADPPYGTTKCKWDAVIPFEPMWAQLKRVLKPNGTIVLTASQPFTSALICSNLEMFKYSWVWEKTKAGNYIQIKNMPAIRHEDVCVFSDGVVIHKGQSKRRMQYNPIGVESCDIDWQRPNICSEKSEHQYLRPSHTKARKITTKNYPSSVIKINSVQNIYHPTQKPVALMEYLIETYSSVGETVLDFSMGSGSTGVAAKNLNRNFVGIELNKRFFKTAEERIYGDTSGDV